MGLTSTRSLYELTHSITYGDWYLVSGIGSLVTDSYVTDQFKGGVVGKFV
jgi:hypothetical protein